MVRGFFDNVWFLWSQWFDGFATYFSTIILGHKTFGCWVIGWNESSTGFTPHRRCFYRVVSANLSFAVFSQMLNVDYLMMSVCCDLLDVFIFQKWKREKTYFYLLSILLLVSLSVTNIYHISFSILLKHISLIGTQGFCPRLSSKWMICSLHFSVEDGVCVCVRTGDFNVEGDGGFVFDKIISSLTFTPLLEV